MVAVAVAESWEIIHNGNNSAELSGSIGHLSTTQNQCPKSCNA